MTETRPLTAHERAVLEYFLEGDDAVSVALRAQLPHALHAGWWFEGSQSFDIEFEADVVPAPSGRGPWGGANVMYDREYVGMPFAWINANGLLNSFEYAWTSI